MAFYTPKIIAGNRSRFLLRLIIIGISQAGVAVFSAFFIKQVFDHMHQNATIYLAYPAIYYALALIALALISAWLRLAERVEAERLGQAYTYQLRMILYDRLSSLSPRVLQKHGKGGLMLRFMGDLSAIRLWVSQGIAKLTVAGVTTFCILILLAQINGMMALIVAAAVTLGISGTLLLGPKLETAAVDVRKRRNYLANNINEKITSISVVQMFNQTDREKRQVDRQSKRLMYAMLYRARIMGQLRAITEATSSIAIAIIVVTGYDQVLNGNMTPGTVIAAITILGFLSPSLRDLGRVHEYWKNSRVSFNKIERFFRTRSLVKQAKNASVLSDGPGALCFKQVSFHHSINQFSLQVEARSVVVIVGPNGAGKSTLLALAARQMDPDHGLIEIDGINIADVKLSSVRKTIGLVSPELPLLRGTIDKNLRYRWRNAPESEINRIKQLCNIDEMLAELADGEQTRVINEGKNLSFGQRQRIMLARALLGNPRILLLDEADANLDPKAAVIIDRIIENYNGTVLLVTHRIERLFSADNIVHIADGRLIEQGPPEQLMNNNGPTRKLFQQQLAS